MSVVTLVINIFVVSYHTVNLPHSHELLRFVSELFLQHHSPPAKGRDRVPLVQPKVEVGLNTFEPEHPDKRSEVKQTGSKLANWIKLENLIILSN